MTNNDILKKLRVALKLRDEDIVDILTLAEFKVSKSEVNALFRAEDHPNYQECGDQLLRNFLNGLVIYMRGPEGEMRKPATETKIVKREKPKLIVKKAIVTKSSDRQTPPES
jgi:hypothetical protein